jgi:hypothetical protein
VSQHALERVQRAAGRRFDQRHRGSMTESYARASAACLDGARLRDRENT